MNEKYMGYFEENAIKHMEWKLKKEFEVQHISSGHLEGTGTIHVILWNYLDDEMYRRTICINHLVINKMFSFEIEDMSELGKVLTKSHRYEGVLLGHLDPEEENE